MARKRRVIVDLDLTELSGVDVPAQEGATTRAFKNANGAPTMKTTEQYEAELAEMQKRLTRAETLATMSDVQKAHMRTLDPEDRPSFVAKSAAERDAVVKAAADADPVVYESKRTGKSFRRSQADLADLAKQLDESEESKQEVVKAARGERIAKRAAALTNLSDDNGGLTALVDAVDRMTDPKVQKAASAILDSINAQAGDFQARPTGVQRGAASANLESARKAYEDYLAEYAQKKGISIAEATVKAVETDAKARKLQKAYREEDKAAKAATR